MFGTDYTLNTDNVDESMMHGMYMN